jgi:hypothetical protein
MREPRFSHLLKNLFEPAYDERLKQWVAVVDGVIAQLSIKGLPVENLRRNQIFVSTLFEASLIAARNHSREKLGALSHALIASATVKTIEEQEALELFIKLIDELSSQQLKMLSSEEGWISSIRIEDIFDERSFGGVDTSLAKYFTSNLLNRGLIEEPPDERPFFATSSDTPRTASYRRTLFGERFKRFLREGKV